MTVHLFDSASVLITGASSGIGAELARQLHGKGANVCLVARREELLRDLARPLEERRPGSTTILAADLDLPADVERVCRHIETNRVDILVNNAGFGSFGEFETRPIERELAMIRLNVSATVRLAHAVVPQLKERRSGGIISVSSVAGFQPLPFMATYSATKAFNLHHSLALRYELRPFGVRVVTLCPGPVATEFGGVARVPGTVTGGIRDTVELVATETLRAYALDRPWIVPGTKSWLLSIASRSSPRWLSTRLVARMLGGVAREPR